MSNFKIRNSSVVDNEERVFNVAEIQVVKDINGNDVSIYGLTKREKRSLLINRKTLLENELLLINSKLLVIDAYIAELEAVPGSNE